MAHWPRPLLNPPHLVGNLDRDKLHRLLSGIEGLEIPATEAVTRAQLTSLLAPANSPDEIAEGLRFPIIVRPRGSHAGVGLGKVDDRVALGRYLAERSEAEFFVSRFVDYANEDGLFRKYRIVFIDGRAYACHMAIADRWDIWYLNAGMALTRTSASRKQASCAISTWRLPFAIDARWPQLAERVGLDYFTVDCAENRNDELLIFEADNTAVVHNMDSPELFPYKAPQMHKIFDAFAAMLIGRVREARERAA